MRRSLVLSFALLALPSLASAQAREWHLTEDSTVRFTCAGEGVTRAARGRFASLSGTVSVDPASLSGATGAVELQLVSIATWDAAWDAMFRRAPFLGIEEHPRARFEVRSVAGATSLASGQEARVTLVGQMSLHGVIRDLRIPARVEWTAASGDTPEELVVRARFDVAWDDYRIAVPTGWTRRFAGDRAEVEVRLHYRIRAGS